jgi:hypothetical protein
VPGKDGKPEIAWNVTQWIDFVNTVQQTAIQYGNSSVPIIYGLDSVHGTCSLRHYSWCLDSSSLC